MNGFTWGIAAWIMRTRGLEDLHYSDIISRHAFRRQQQFVEEHEWRYMITLNNRRPARRAAVQRAFKRWVKAWSFTQEQLDALPVDDSYRPNYTDIFYAVGKLLQRNPIEVEINRIRYEIGHGTIDPRYFHYSLHKESNHGQVVESVAQSCY